MHIATAEGDVTSERSAGRVLVFVEDGALAELLLDALADAGHGCDHASAQDQLLTLLNLGIFDSAIIDLDSRTVEARRAIATLRAHSPSTKIVLLLPCGGLPPHAEDIPHHLAIAKPARLQALLTALAAAG